MQRLDLWPTVLFSSGEGEDAGPRELVRRAILAEREATPGIVRANRGGWHSVPDLALRADPVWQVAIARVMRAVGEASAALAASAGVALPPLRPRVQAWALVLGPGDGVILHDHAESDWSAVWYVDSGDGGADGGGAIVFTDVRRVRSPLPGVEVAPSLCTVQPVDGQVLVFPGWLPHFVHPYGGTRPRVCVSANVIFER